MEKNPSRLEENVDQLNLQKDALIRLKDEVVRRGIQGKQEWINDVEGIVDEINQITKAAAKLRKGGKSARTGLNNKVIQVLRDVNVLKERRNANSKTVETVMKNVATATITQYSGGQLRSITSEYSRKIGSGAFGVIYEGQFPSGLQVAVKVLSDNNLSEELFKSEVSTTGSVSHKNLVKLYGFCFEERGTKALVYEYMNNGSLDKILDGKGPVLDWDKLYAIAIETADGLYYLHEGCKKKIIHHDIKPSNILLDSNFSPIITDFALARVMNRDVSHRTNTRARGSIGYAAPEIWVPSSKITPKCDVYSFGVLLFDILKIRFKNPIREWFPKIVWARFRAGKLDEIINECGIMDKNGKNAKTMAIIALWCIQQTPQMRPPMSTVVMMLEERMQVPEPPNPFVPKPESLLSPWEKSLNDKGKATIRDCTNSILDSFEKKCPPGGEDSIILYTTTRRRSMFSENCTEVLSILRSQKVEVIERDYDSMETMLELAELLGQIELPALFVHGRFIGGAIQVKEMHADGRLNTLFAQVK